MGVSERVPAFLSNRSMIFAFAVLAYGRMEDQGVSDEIKSRPTTIAELNRLQLLPLKPTPSISIAAYVKHYVYGLDLAVEHPGGGEATYTVCSSHLSEWSALVFHSGYLHHDTTCRLSLPTVWGSSRPVDGIIQSCWLLSGRIHGVLVRFNQPIELTKHISREYLPQRFEEEAAEQEALEGECLTILTDPLEQRVMAHLVEKTGLTVHRSAELGDAIDQIRRRSVCLMVVDDTAGDIPDFIDAIRNVGYSGRVLVLTSTSDSVENQRVLAAGADRIISKPYKSHDLTRCVRDLFSGEAAADLEPIGSTLLPDDGLLPVIEEFVTHVSEAGVKIRHASAKNDLAAVRAIAESLRLSGGSFGFDLLSESAAEALKQLDATSSIGESMEQIQALDRACGRLKAVPASEASAGKG